MYVGAYAPSGNDPLKCPKCGTLFWGVTRPPDLPQLGSSGTPLGTQSEVTRSSSS
jgi:hypothetical protein